MDKKDRVLNMLRIFSTIAVTAMVLVSITVYHAKVSGLLIFLFFILFYVQIPGLFIAGLSGLSFEHRSERLLLSFFAGWFMTVCVYLLSCLAETVVPLYTAGPLCSAAYVYRLYRDGWKSSVLRGIRFRRIPAAFYIAFVILMAYVLLTTQYLYMSPGYCQTVYASIDKVYQAGLISSLSHGYPLVDPWVAGRTVHYHIFSQILLSVPVRLFGLRPDFLVMSCSPYLTVYLVSLSFYAVFVHFCSRRDRAGLYTLSILLSHMFIARSFDSSYLFRILFTNDNHGGFAIACLSACVIALDLYFRPDGGTSAGSLKELLLTAALVMTLTGIKAPVALVLVGGMTGTWILGMIMGKLRFRDTLPIMVASAAGFFIIFVFLIGSDESTGIGDDSLFRFGTLTNVCFWKSSLIGSLKSLGLPSPVRLLAILLAFAVAFFTIYLLAFFIGYIREFVLVVMGSREFSFARISIYAAALVGLVLMMFLSYSGHSQIYFGIVAVPFVPLISFLFFEDKGGFRNRFTDTLFRISRAWFFALLIVTMASLAMCFRGLILDAVYHTDPAATFNPYRSLSSSEYEAMEWLRHNTPEDSLIATRMYASESTDEYSAENRWHNCHFLYAAYSDRYFYLEGSGFSFADSETGKRVEMIENTEKLYDPDNKERAELARSLGIDYVIVTKKLHPAPDLASDDYELVFSNEDVDIYHVAS